MPFSKKKKKDHSGTIKYFAQTVPNFFAAENTKNEQFLTI